MLKIGAKVRTVAAVYAAKQKRQQSGLEKLPAGVVGVIKGSDTNSMQVRYFTVKFDVDGQKYFAKLSGSILEPITVDSAAKVQ